MNNLSADDLFEQTPDPATQRALAVRASIAEKASRLANAPVNANGYIVANPDAAQSIDVTQP